MRHSLLCAAALALGAHLPAQSPTISRLFKHTHQANGLGQSILGLGDINNDGHGDYAVGHSNPQAIEYLAAISGRTGVELWRVSAQPPTGFGSLLVKVPDRDSDGIPDLLVGAPQSLNGTGEVTLRSARTGALLGVMSVGGPGDRFGSSMAAVDDVNGDGGVDYIVGAPGYPGGAGWGRAVVISGASLTTVLADHQGFTPGRQLGEAVLGAGDIDNDGRGDYLIGEPYAGIQGQVRCYSGRFRILLYTLADGTAAEGFGYRLTRPGDLDRDGGEDLLVSIYANGNGGINAHDLRTGAFLYRVPGGGGYSLGNVLAPTGDLDGDSAADFAAGAPARGVGTSGYRNGAVELYSGRTGQKFFEFGPPEVLPYHDLKFGQSVSTGDIDGDGRTDFLVGQPGYAFQGAGIGVAAWSLAYRKWPLTTQGHTLSITGGGRVSLDLDAGVGNANRFYWFLATASGQQPGFDVLGQHIPLNPDPAMLLFLSNINSTFLPTQLGVLNGTGRGGTFFQLVPGLGGDLIGVTFDFAAVVFCAPFPTTMCIDLASNARPVTLVP